MKQLIYIVLLSTVYLFSSCEFLEEIVELEQPDWVMTSLNDNQPRMVGEYRLECVIQNKANVPAPPSKSKVEYGYSATPSSNPNDYFIFDTVYPTVDGISANTYRSDIPIIPLTYGRGYYICKVHVNWDNLEESDYSNNQQYRIITY